MADNQDYMNNLIDQGSFDNNEVEAEMALLALCMRKDTAILGTVENRIEEGDFTDVRNRIIFNVISDISGFCQSCGVCDCQRHIQKLRQCFYKISLSTASWTNH